MNKKTIIQLVVIIVAFGAAGVVLYNGFFKNNATISQNGEPSGSSAAATSQSILPYGDTLDFSKVLDPNRFQYNQINYPQLDAQNDVGVSPDSLIIAAPVTQPSQ